MLQVLIWCPLPYSLLLLAPHNAGYYSYEEASFFLQHEFHVEFKIAIEILLTSTVKKEVCL